MEAFNSQIGYLNNLRDTGIINPEEYLKRLDTSYRMKPNLFSEEDLDYIEKAYKKYDMKWNRNLEKSGASLLSVVNQFTSGVVEGFTTLGWADEGDTAVERIAGQFGHLLGFAPDVIASVISGGRWIPIAVAKNAARTSSKAVRQGISSVASKSPALLRKEISPNTFALQSIPMMVADKVLAQSKAALGSTNMVTTGMFATGLFGKASVRNAASQALHLGVALGVSSWKDGPKAMLDATMHGAAAGGIFGSIGNYVRIGDMLRVKSTQQMGREAVRLASRQLYQDPNKYEGIEMLIKGGLGAAFQGGRTTLQGAPLPEQIYEYLLGFFFGASAKSAGFMNRTKFINDRYFPSNENITKVKEKWKSDPEYKELPKVDRQYIDNYLESIRVQQLNVINKNRPSWHQNLSQTVKDAAKEAGVDLTRPITVKNKKKLDTAVSERDKIKSPKKDSVTKEGINTQLPEISEGKKESYKQRYKKQTKTETKSDIVAQVSSGLQSGADYGGLKGAKRKGLKTGGWVTGDFKTKITGSKKAKEKLLKEYGVKKVTESITRKVEGGIDRTFKLNDYANRTIRNIEDNDATIIFALPEHIDRSVGTNKTIGYASEGIWQRGASSSTLKSGSYQSGFRPYQIITRGYKTKEMADVEAKKLRKFITDLGTKLKKTPNINIAGHGNDRVKGNKQWKSFEDYVDYVVDKALEGTVKESAFEPNVDHPAEILAGIPATPKNIHDYAEERLGDYKGEIELAMTEIDAASSDSSSKTILRRPLHIAADYIVSVNKKLLSDNVKLQINDLAEKVKTDIEFFEKVDIKFGVQLPENIRKELGRALLVKKNIKEVRDHGIRDLDVFNTKKKGEGYEGSFKSEQFPSEDIDGTILVKYRTENKNDKHVKGAIEDVSYVISSVQYDKSQTRSFQNIDGVEGPQIYKLQYAPILTHAVPRGKADIITGRKDFEFSLTEKGFNKLNEKLGKDGYYVSKALKDKGVVLVEPYALQEKNQYDTNYLSVDSQKLVLKELGVVPKTPTERKVFMSNIYYLLKEHTLKGMKGHGKLDADLLIKGIQELRANNNQKLNYKDVVEYNKYSALDIGTNIPLKATDYDIYDAGSKMGVVYLKDIPTVVHGVEMIGNTDSVHNMRSDVYNQITKRHYVDLGDGKIKLTFFRGPRNNINLIKNKIGTDINSKALDIWMQKQPFPIHHAIYESGGKSNKGNFPLVDLKWDAKKGEYYTDKPLIPRDIIDYNYNEMYVDLGVREDSSHMNRGVNVGKQMYNSVSMAKLRHENKDFANELDNDISDWIESSTAGDAKLGIEIMNSFKSGKEITRDFDVYMIPDGVITDMKNDISREGINNPVFKQVLKKIVESNERDLSAQVWDPTKSSELRSAIQDNYQVAEILSMSNYDPLVFGRHPYKDFINRALWRFDVNRRSKPRDPDGFQTPFMGLNAEELEVYKVRTNQGPNKITTGVGENMFMLGRHVRGKPIRIEAIPSIKNMGQAWDMLTKSKLSKTEVIQIQDVLNEITLLRVPNSAISGARVPGFGGFVDKQGMGLYTSAKEKYYMDGTDNDFDESFVHFNIPKSLNKVFKSNRDFLKDEKGNLINLETPPEWLTKEGYFIPYEAKKPNDVLIDMVNPWKRLQAGRSAALGKEAMGGAINSLDRQISIMDAIINTKITEPSRSTPYMLVNVTKTDSKQNPYYGDAKDSRIVLMDGKGNEMTSTNTKDYLKLFKEFEIDALKIKNGYADSPKYLNIIDNFKLSEMTWEKYFKVQTLHEGKWTDLAGTAHMSWGDITGKADYRKKKKGQRKASPILKIREIENLAQTYKLLYGNPNIPEINKSPLVFKEFIDNPDFRHDLQSYNTAKKLHGRMDWALDSFDYIRSLSKGFNHLYDNSMEPYDFVLRMTTELHKRLINSKYHDKFSLIPNYRDEIQAVLSLKRSANFMFKELKAIGDKKYKSLSFVPTREIENHFHNALDLNVADYISDMFITKIGKSRLTGMSVDEGFQLVKDIQTRVNEIKESWYYTNNRFRDKTGYNVKRERLDYKWINQELIKLKARYRQVPTYKPFIKDIDLVIESYINANPRFRFKELRNPTTEKLVELVNKHSNYIAEKLDQYNIDDISKLTPENYEGFIKDNSLIMIERSIRFRENALNVLYDRVPHFDRSKVISPENRAALLKLKRGILTDGLEAVNKKLRVPKSTSAVIKSLTESYAADTVLEIDNINNKKVLKSKQKELDEDIKSQKLDPSDIKKPPVVKKVKKDGDIDNLFGIKTSRRKVLASKFVLKKQGPAQVKEQAVTEIKRVFKKQFSFLDGLDSNIMEPTTKENAEVLKEFKSIFEEFPQVLPNLDWYFGSFTKTSEGVMRDISTMSSRDAIEFVKQLKRSFNPMKGLVGRDGKFKEKPRKRDHMYFYDIVGDRLGFMSELELKPMLENKMMANGEIKQVYMKQPMSPLHLMKEHVDFTDTITKAARDNIEKVHAGYFQYLISDDPMVQRHRKLLEEHAVNTVEWNNGKFPSGEPISYSSKTFLTKKYNDSRRAIRRLEKEKVRILYKGKPLKPSVFVSQHLVKDIDQFTNWVWDNYVSSRHVNIKETFLHISTWNPEFKLWKPNQIFKPAKEYKKLDGTKYDIMKLEEMFLDKDSAVFRQDRYTAFYDSIMNYQGAYKKKDGLFKKSNVNGQFNNREISQYLQPSYNDMLFLKYHMKLTEEAQDIFTNFDVKNPDKMTKSQKAKVRKFITDRMKSDGSYHKLFDNKVGEGYFPRNGHTDIKANAREIQGKMLEIVDSEMANITSPDRLPPHIRNKMKLKDPERGRALSFPEAKQVFKAEKLSLHQKEFMNSALEGQLGNELAINDLMSRERSYDERYIGDYTYAPMHKRGPWIMPHYRLDTEALRIYAGGLVKAHLTNTTGLNLEYIVKKFDKVNDVENDINALGWSGYLRDAGLNMMGLSLHKSLQVHGIQEKHKPLYESFVYNSFSTKGLRLNKAEKDLIFDFKEAIDLSPARKGEILLWNKGNIEKANDQFMSELKNNAKRMLKHVNLTGKYGSLYHMTSDDAVGSKMESINSALGAKLFGELSADPAQKRAQINEGLRYLSNLEGKYELLSLLSAPKTPITNFIGGYGNLISDVGLNPVRKSFNTEWMLQNLFLEKNYDTGKMEGARYEFFNNDTKSIEQKKMTSMDDIFNWMDGSIGVFDTTQLQLVAIEKHFGRKNAAKVVRQFAERLAGARDAGYDMQTPASRNRLRDATIMELASEYKVTDSIVDLGAFFMRESERHLRGHTFLANMIFHKTNTLATPDGFAQQISFNNPGLIRLSLQGVKASQFLYQATERPNFSNTALGRVLTRFQPYAWNSIRRRMHIYRDARSVGFDYKKIASKKFQRQVSFDMFSLALANIFVASIFEYSLSPPMNWMQDTAQLLLGDETERERAFFNQYPSKVLAPLQAVTPPVMRFILPPITATLNGDYERFFKFQFATYFPFGRLGRDLYRTYQSPAMAVDFMTGLPLHKIHTMRRDQIEDNEELSQIEEEINDI